MNVTVKPLVWQLIGKPNCHMRAITPFGNLDIRRRRFANVKWDVLMAMRRVLVAADVDAASCVLLAERWYTAKVLDCLDPADRATCAEFVTVYSQCNGEVD